jgi:hypothetical protein
MKKFPQRPLSHVSGDDAVSIFRTACPSEWIISPIQPDYGLDLRVELTQNSDVTGEEFYVQIKGRQSVKVIPSQAVEVEISQATINYWLGKLHPVLVVLVDVPNKQFWFDWLENAYPFYPKLRDEEEKVKLSLSQSNTSVLVSEFISKYLKDYFIRVRGDISKIFESTQIVRMLFHISQLWKLCSKMIMFLQTNTKTLADSEIIKNWQAFYQEFALHDLVLRLPWHQYANRVSESSRNIVFALESRFKAYESLRSTFYDPEDATEIQPDVPLIQLIPLIPNFSEKDMKLMYIKPKYHELLENIFPTIYVLQDIEDILFQLLLIGRVKFKED